MLEDIYNKILSIDINDSWVDAVHESFISIKDKLENDTIKDKLGYWIKSARNIQKLKYSKKDGILPIIERYPFDYYSVIENALQDLNLQHWNSVLIQLTDLDKIEQIRDTFPDVLTELWGDTPFEYNNGWITTQETYAYNSWKYMSQEHGMPKPIWIDRNRRVRYPKVPPSMYESIQRLWDTLERIYNVNKCYIYSVVADTLRIPWYTVCAGSIAGPNPTDTEWLRILRRSYAFQKEIQEWYTTSTRQLVRST